MFRFYACTELLSALKHLHLVGYVHGDLKPDNVLVQYTTDGYFSVKLGDLGFAMSIGKVMYGPHGTAHYEAPEHMLNYNDVRSIPAHPCIDTWSFGVILAETLVGFPLNSKMKSDRSLRRIHRQRLFYDKVVHKYLCQVPGITPKWVELVKRCLEYNPLMRPTADELMSMFVSHDDWAPERRGEFVEFSPPPETQEETEVLPDMVRTSYSLLPSSLSCMCSRILDTRR